MSPTVRVTRPAAWSRAASLIERASERDPTLAASAERIRRVVASLDDLGRLSPGALGDAPWDGQVFRTVVERWNGLALDPRRVAELVRGERAPFGAPDPAAVDGIVDMGALVPVGLAALRVGAPRGLARDYLATVFGMVLSCGRAEAIGRLLAPPDEEVVAARHLLAPAEDGSAESAALQLLADPVERDRWRVLVTLFEELSAEGDGGALQALLEEGSKASTLPEWMGLHPGLALGGLRDDLRPGETAPLVTSPVDWPADDVAVAFRWTGEAPGAARAAPTSAGTVRVPRTVRSGWVGLFSPSRTLQANRERHRLRQRWTGLAERLIGPGAAAVDAIPDLDPAASLPPWPLSRPFRGGPPEVVWADAERERDGLRVRWATRAADFVEIPAAGGRMPPCGDAHVRWAPWIVVVPGREDGLGAPMRIESDPPWRRR